METVAVALTSRSGVATSLQLHHSFTVETAVRQIGLFYGVNGIFMLRCTESSGATTITPSSLLDQATNVTDMVNYLRKFPKVELQEQEITQRADSSAPSQVCCGMYG